MEADTCENSPLQVRIYGAKVGDYQLVNAWWQKRHGEPLLETLLPRVGVMVERDGEALGALWCYETYGVGLAFLEHPITRPNMGLSQAKAVLKLAVEACILLVKENGDFNLFKCYTIPAIGRVLPSLGFVQCTPNSMTGFALRRD